MGRILIRPMNQGVERSVIMTRNHLDLAIDTESTVVAMMIRVMAQFGFAISADYSICWTVALSAKLHVIAVIIDERLHVRQMRIFFVLFGAVLMPDRK